MVGDPDPWKRRNKHALGLDRFKLKNQNFPVLQYLLTYNPTDVDQRAKHALVNAPTNFYIHLQNKQDHKQ